MDTVALAKQMGVSESDLICLAQSVARSIEQDKAAEAFAALDSGFQVEMVEAYVIHANRKMQSFVTTYMTAGRASFQTQILQLAKEA